MRRSQLGTNNSRFVKGEQPTVTHSTHSSPQQLACRKNDLYPTLRLCAHAAWSVAEAVVIPSRSWFVDNTAYRTDGIYIFVGNRTYKALARSLTFQ